jgi:predicted transcriptional regulator of viral defense system
VPHTLGMRNEEAMGLICSDAAERHGVTSRKRVLGYGVHRNTLRRLISAKSLIEPVPGALVIPGTPETFLQRVSVACEATGGVACGVTAAIVHGLTGLKSTHVEVMIPANRKPPEIDGIRIRRSNYLPDDDVDWRRGVPVTSMPRTLQDLGTNVGPARVRRAVLEALDRKLVTIEQLVEQLRCAGRSGRPGTAFLRKVVDELATTQELGELSDSDLEEQAVRILVDRGYPEPLLHFKVFDGGVFLGETDLYYPMKALDVEVDSPGFHIDLPSFYRDRRRQNSLVAAGITVVRFTDEDARRPLRFLSDFSRIWKRL